MLKTNIAFRNSLANQLNNLFTGGTIEIRTGAQPATADTAASGTLLATIPLPVSPFAAASGGAVAKSGAWLVVAIATGTSGYARFKNVAGTMAFDVTVAETGGDLTIDDDAIVSGGVVLVTAFTYTFPTL